MATISGANNIHLLEQSLILLIVVSVQHVNLDIVNNDIGKSDAPINKVLPSIPTSPVLSACIHQLAHSRKTLHKRDYVYWAKEGGNNPFRLLVIQLLLLSGDIHCNPGPVKHPCSVCERLVAINHRALQCDQCDEWVHIKCDCIYPQEYTRFTHLRNLSWECPSCRIPNFTD